MSRLGGFNPGEGTSFEGEKFVFSQENFMIDDIRPFSRKYMHHTRRSAYPCLPEYREIHAALNALCGSHIAMTKVEVFTLVKTSFSKILLNLNSREIGL